MSIWGINHGFLPSPLLFGSAFLLRKCSVFTIDSTSTILLLPLTGINTKLVLCRSIFAMFIYHLTGFHIISLKLFSMLYQSLQVIGQIGQMMTISMQGALHLVHDGSPSIAETVKLMYFCNILQYGERGGLHASVW